MSDEDRVEKLEDDRIEKIDENVKRILKVLEGNGSEGLVVKCERNSLRSKLTCWLIGVIYIAFVTGAIAYVFKAL